MIAVGFILWALGVAAVITAGVRAKRNTKVLRADPLRGLALADAMRVKPELLFCGGVVLVGAGLALLVVSA